MSGWRDPESVNQNGTIFDVEGVTEVQPSVCRHSDDVFGKMGMTCLGVLGRQLHVAAFTVFCLFVVVGGTVV